MQSLSPETAYQQATSKPGFFADPSQERAIQILQASYLAVHQKPTQACSGVYLWGPVGRGKTCLMDMFYGCLRVPARRQHFHHFMRWVHRRLFEIRGTVDPLLTLARELARDVKVLCFDELFVSDIGDAMLLGRLFQALFDAGLTIVATSNQAPEQLYEDGFNRERFLPAIAALQQHMQVIEMDGDQDHRQHPGASLTRYWIADAEALPKLFAQLSGNQSITSGSLTLRDRQLRVVHYCTAAVWLQFDALCGQAFAAADFIALCDRFPVILLGGVPKLSAPQRPARIARGTEDGASRVEAGDRNLPALSVNDDSVRRFIALVDECYDRRIPLYIEAAVPLLELYTDGYLAFSFRRTLSRLQEMQLQRFASSTNAQ